MSPYMEEPTTHELLRLALRELVGQSALKDRLRSAAQYVMQMDAHDWPQAFQLEITDIRNLLQATRALRGETAVTATIRKLSLGDAEIIAKRLIDLSFNLMEAMPVPFKDSQASSKIAVAETIGDHDNNIIPLFAEH